MAPLFPVTEAYIALYLSFPKIEKRMTVEKVFMLTDKGNREC